MAEDDAFRKGLALASRVGLELVAATVLGAGLGYALDRWLGTGPWLLVVGVVLGAAAGFLAVYRLVNASDS
jgi:ATP synthase protein I